jgi:hypothetical protein
MKSRKLLLTRAAVAVALFVFPNATTHGQTTTTGGSATGGSATSNGGTATGGSAVGGNATATGGSATAGSATGGSAVGGRATGGSVTAGTATATVGNREITASAARANVQTEGDSARVQLDDHVLTVEPERLLVDGGERARLPASAKKIRLSLSDGRLSVVADGQPVLSQKLSKD